QRGLLSGISSASFFLIKFSIFYNGNFLCEFVLARIPIIENQRAFVAPADIQSFTSEAKNKLSTRLQGKTRYFAQAVKEICATFKEMQK
ncbi:unnamed protein product, partial [Sphenostylis stenocarpa]